MKIEQIYSSWGRILTFESYDEIMALPNKYLVNLTLKENFIVVRGLGPDLPDDDLYAIGGKFGRVWDDNDFAQPYISRGNDTSLIKGNSVPVSYFRSSTNMFTDEPMGYHADMPHVKEQSFPGRILYIVDNTSDGSGSTRFLNLELAWEQCTDEEKKQFDGLQIVMQDMYRPGTRIETVPFLKTNPKTGKISPALNSYARHEKSESWIRNIVRNGIDLNFEESCELISNAIALFESKVDTLYPHVWQDGDMLIFNNWFNIHNRTAVNNSAARNGERLLKRVTFNYL